MLFDVFLKDGFDGFGHDGIEHLLFAHLVAAHKVHFEFSERGRVEVPEIADTGDGGLFSQHSAAAACAGDHSAVVGEAEPGTNAGLLIDVAAFSRLPTDFLDDLLHEPRHGYREFAIERQVAFLFEDANTGIAFMGVVGADQAADAVFELGDNFAAAVVGRGVGREEDHDVEIELDGVAANLHVAFFKNVEQTDLDELVKFGEFVHGEEAAMHAGNQAEVQGFFGGHAGASGKAGWIDFADDVGKAGTGCESFGVALFARPPAYRNLVIWHFSDAPATLAGDRLVGIFMDGAAREIEIGEKRIEKPGKHPHDATLALALFTEEQDVMSGEECEADFGDHCAFVADHPRKQFFAGSEEFLEVVADFLFDRAGLPAGGAEFSEVRGERRGGHLEFPGWMC